MAGHWPGWQQTIIDEMGSLHKDNYKNAAGLVACWANKWFLGCQYPQGVHDIIDKWPAPRKTGGLASPTAGNSGAAMEVEESGTIEIVDDAADEKWEDPSNRRAAHGSDTYDPPRTAPRRHSPPGDEGDIVFVPRAQRAWDPRQGNPEPSSPAQTMPPLPPTQLPTPSSSRAPEPAPTASGRTGPRKPVNPVSAVYQFCSKSIPQKTADFRFAFGSCNLFINGQHFISIGGSNQRDSKHDCAKAAVAKLKTDPSSRGLMESILSRKHHFLKRDDTKAIGRDLLVVGDPSQTAELPQSNVGFQIMISVFAWKPGMGLGKDRQGIVEPIAMNLHTQTSREGLGYLEDSPEDAKVMKALGQGAEAELKRFMASNKFQLQFSPQLKKKERAKIHNLAQRLGLKSKSLGKGKERCLFVFKRGAPR